MVAIYELVNLILAFFVKASKESSSRCSGAQEVLRAAPLHPGWQLGSGVLADTTLPPTRPINHLAGLGDALEEVGVGAGVFAHAAVEAVFEQGGELAELGFDGEAGGFAFADLLGGFVFVAAEGTDGVAQLLQAGLRDAVRGQGRGVGGGGGKDAVGGVEQGSGAFLA